MEIIIRDIVFGLLIALGIIVIIAILDRREKSRNKPDNTLGSLELHSGKISDAKPFDYRALWWKKLSRQYREQEKWRCQACNLSLHRHKYYLHTHHIRGTLYNAPKDLIVLCIGCHSEQPGENHYRLKDTRDYRGFIKRYGKNWRREMRRTSSAVK